MRFVLTALLSLLGTSALAGDCDRWTASMQEEEIGPVMTASICAPASAGDPDSRHDLLIQCPGKGNLWIRYLPFIEKNYPPGGDEEFKTEMKFSLGNETFVEPARYEAMDGAMAMEITVDAPMISAMMNQKQLVLSDASGKIPDLNFTLSGAREALETLIRSCKP